MFLDVTKGHWLSMFRNRFPIGAPAIEMRVWTKDLPEFDRPNLSGAPRAGSDPAEKRREILDRRTDH
jgi:hypothetical protein